MSFWHIGKGMGQFGSGTIKVEDLIFLISSAPDRSSSKSIARVRGTFLQKRKEASNAEENGFYHAPQLNAELRESEVEEKELGSFTT